MSLSDASSSETLVLGMEPPSPFEGKATGEFDTRSDEDLERELAVACLMPTY